MIELRNEGGQILGWKIRSAFEARIVGRAAVLHDPHEATTLFIYHKGEDGVTSSEVEFLDREALHGDLVVGKTVALHAEEAFRKVADSDRTWNSITPAVARAFVEVIDAGRIASAQGEASDQDIATQLPEPDGPISVTQQQVPQAA